MKCENCGNEIHAEGATHCTRCGAVLGETIPEPMKAARRCPGCDALLPDPEPPFCPGCGRGLTAGATLDVQPATPSESALSRISEHGITPIAALFGAIAAILLISLLAAVGRPGSYLQLMFFPAGVLRAIPWAISFFFFWSAFVLWFRYSRLRVQKAYLDSQIVTEIERALDTLGPEGVLARIEQTKSASNSTLIRRIQGVLEAWRTGGSKEYAQSALRQESDLDSDCTASGYSLVRVFVWAMPVLGLIGTVVGISLAVSSFSSFLGGEIGNIEAVKRQLVGVTYGLSFAFLITLDGLLAALLVMLPTAALQKSEEDFLGMVDRYCLDRIVSRLESGGVTPGRSVSVDISGRLEELFEKHMPAAAGWEDAVKAFTKATLEYLAQGVKSIQTDLDQTGRAQLEATRQAAVDISGQLVAQLDANRQSVVDTAGQMVAQLDANRQSASELAGQLEARTSTLQQSLLGYCERFERASGQLDELVNQMQRLGTVQETMKSGLDQLATGESLDATLKGMRDTLQNMQPLLARLSGPMEFRLVPGSEPPPQDH